MKRTWPKFARPPISRLVRLTAAATKMDRTLKVTRHSSAGPTRTYGTREVRSRGGRNATMRERASCRAAVTVIRASGSSVPARTGSTPARQPVMLGLEAADSDVQRGKRAGLVGPLEDDAVERVEQGLADLVPLRNQGQQLRILRLAGVGLYHRAAGLGRVGQSRLRRWQLIRGFVPGQLRAALGEVVQQPQRRIDVLGLGPDPHVRAGEQTCAFLVARQGGDIPFAIELRRRALDGGGQVWAGDDHRGGT